MNPLIRPIVILKTSLKVSTTRSMKPYKGQRARGKGQRFFFEIRTAIFINLRVQTPLSQMDNKLRIKTPLFQMEHKLRIKTPLFSNGT